MTYTVLEDLLDLVEVKLNRFVRKFNKYGNGIFNYSKSEPYLKTITDENNETHIRSFVDIEVTGNYKIEGYEFIASLEYFPEINKNIIKKSPETNIEVPEIYLTRTQCDHCKSNRFRKYTIILRNIETGEFIQLGKSCVKDYMGVDVNNYIAYLSMFKDIEDYLETLGKDKTSHPVEYFEVNDILEQAVARKNDIGYISKSTVNKWYKDNYNEEYDIACPFTTTASDIFQILNPNVNIEKEYRLKRYNITKEIKEEVNIIKEFINNSIENSNYITNLKTLLELGYVKADNIGMVVSIVGYYLRKINEIKEKENKIESQFIGNIGDKINFTSVPECIFTTESQYGIMRIYRFIVDNNEIIWKTNKLLDDRPVTLRATIKAHNMYRNIKQTEITRARVV